MPLYVVDQVLRARPRLGRQSSRLDEAMRAGQQASPTGAYGAAAIEGLTAREQIIANKKKQVLETEKQLLAQREQEADDQQREEQKAREQDKADEAARRAQLAGDEAEQQQWMKRKSRAEGKYNTVKAQAYVHEDAIYTAKYDDFFDPVKKKLLSPSDAIDYREKLETMNSILAGVSGIADLSNFQKTKTTGNIKSNTNNIEDLTKYIPKITEACNKEKGCAGMAPSPTESTTPSRDISLLQEELQLAKARANAADQAAADCKAMMKDRDAEPCPATVLEAAEKYEVLKQKAVEKKEVHTVVSVRTVKAKSKLQRLEAKLAEAMAAAKAEYESYIAYELGGAQSLNPWRQARQKKLGLANNTVEVLMNEVNEAKAEHDDLYVTYIQTFTDQEVATALAKAAKARADQMKGSVNVVMGKPV